MTDNIKVGDLVETCSLMPGVVMKREGDDIQVRMLHYDEYDGFIYSCCHIVHCGVMKITAQQALDRLKVGNLRLSEIYRDKEINGSWERYNELVSQASKGLINPGPTKILCRDGSEVILQDRLGRIWLTRRKKRRHDNRRRVPHVTKEPSVIYIPIKQLT